MQRAMAGLRERLICRYRQHVEAGTFTVQHTVAVTAEEVITWGANGEGQSGQGERAEAVWVKPRSLRALRGALVTQVVCGSYHTLCVTATSQVILPAKLVALWHCFAGVVWFEAARSQAVCRALSEQQ